MRHPIAASLLLGLMTLGSASCAIDVRGETVTSREEKHFSVDGPAELAVRTFDGTIELRSWDQPDVRVEIERRGPDSQIAAALVVNMTQVGNRIVVEAPPPTEHRNGFLFGRGRSVNLVVTTPRRLTADAHTGDGSIRAGDVSGSLVLTTGDGSITVTRVAGPIRAQSGDGSIRIDGTVGPVEVTTGDGAIDITGRLEGLNVKTGDGSIRVRVEAGSELKQDSTISTGDGAIDLLVPPSLNAELSAHTGDGQIEIDRLAGVDTERDRDRKTIRARLGAGGHALTLRSGDGSIKISR